MRSKSPLPTGSRPETRDLAAHRADQSLIRARVLTLMRAYPPALAGVGIVRVGDVIEAVVRRCQDAT